MEGADYRGKLIISLRKNLYNTNISVIYNKRTSPHILKLCLYIHGTLNE